MAPEVEKVDNFIGRTFRDCKIQEKIAVGGFGTVYKAIDSQLDVIRAIKIFHSHLSEEKGFRKRFETEMRLLAHLDHPNIVRITSAIDEPDATGFIMEYVEGETLSDILENEGNIDIARSIDIFTQIAKSIAYAHNLKNQIIHRDLSPDNVIIRPDGIVKIMDFGIAKTIGSERVTQTGIVLGKPTYMAPEQFEGTVSIYTDQYALGIILYEMVTGRVPFDAESPIALYKLHLNEDPIPPTEINSNIPANLEKAIIKSLAKDETDRFKNMDEMLEALISKGDSGGSNVDNRISSMMLQANDATEDEDFEEALRLLKEILSYEPKNKEALAKREEVTKLKKVHNDQDLIEEWFYRANEFFESGLVDEASGHIVDLLKISRQYKNSKTVKQYQTKLQKKMPDIYNQAVEIVENDWDQVEQYTKRGKAYFQQDQYKEACQEFEKAMLLDPHSEVLQKLKNLTQKKLKMAQVASHYKDGILGIKNGDYQKAFLSFEKVLELHPQHKDAKKYREMAKSELDKIEKTRSEAESTYQEALELYEKWDFTSAIEKFERVLEMDTDHEDAKLLLSESKSRVADENKLEEIGFFYNQGLTFYKGQQWEKSITCFNRVLKYMDSHKGALEYKALAIQKLAQYAEIEKAFNQALEYFRNSQYQESLELLNYILEQDKNHKGARQYKALCNELQGIGGAETQPKSGDTDTIEKLTAETPNGIENMNEKTNDVDETNEMEEKEEEEIEKE